MIDLNSDFSIDDTVAISLFTNNNQWFGEELAGKNGSDLFLLDRAKITIATAETAKETAKRSLQWLVDDDIADDIDVKSLVVNKQQIKLLIKINLNENSNIYKKEFLLCL